MERVVYFGDPKSPGCLSFLEEKERLKISIKMEHKLIDALERHVSEVYTKENNKVATSSQ